MRPFQQHGALSLALWLLASPAVSGDIFPTAIKKVAPNSNEKILPEHLAFSPNFPETPFDTESVLANVTDRFYPAHNLHERLIGSNIQHRVADLFFPFYKRSDCPSGFGDCSSIGSPNKCCTEGTYCSYVPDSDTGHIACCPDGATCGGAIGECPSDAITCSSQLGGGCCIAGYVCQGIGCVPSAAATQATETRTKVQSQTAQAETETVTETQTTMIRGNPTTVVVTVVVSEKPSTNPQTRTTTITESATQTKESSATRTATGGAPYRPTVSSEAITTTTTTTSSTESEATQRGCPTGFYGCLAVNGGGCCRTDRNCDVHDCPAASTVAIATNGATVVVPASEVPAMTTSSCAGGWFLCGKEAGPVAGCCPSGFSCGTASCFISEASRTEARQKEFPTASKDSGALATVCSQSWVRVLASVFAITLSVMP